jgi:hypothetical protein
MPPKKIETKPKTKPKTTKKITPKKRNQKGGAIDWDQIYNNIPQNKPKSDPFNDPVTGEQTQGFIVYDDNVITNTSDNIQGNSYIYFCPWCSEMYFMPKKDLNCKIIRCGYINNPHLRKEQALPMKDSDRVTGCFGPFEIVITPPNSLYTIKRDWNS